MAQTIGISGLGIMGSAMGANLARAGARLLGGCCGTSPAHIKAMVELLEGC